MSILILKDSEKDVSWLRDSVILMSKNDTVAHMNDLLLESFTAETVIYQSVDSVVEVNNTVLLEFQYIAKASGDC